MGTRRIKKESNTAKDRGNRSIREALTISTIAAASGFPILLASFLMTVDMRTDLADLHSTKQWPDSSIALIGWPDLEEAHGKVKMLGYMMDGYTSAADGTPVQMFILMPDAGQFLHAAHRIPSEMVEVWPRLPLNYRYRSLGWASGALENTGRSSQGEKALYAIRGAKVESAENRAITRWFAH